MADSKDQQHKADMEFLLRRPEFLRFLWRSIQMARIFQPTTDGSDDRPLAYWEGRRNLGLELLADAEIGQPIAHPEGLPILTLIQTLREEAQQPSENPNATRRHDRYDDIRDRDGDEAGGDGSGRDD